MDDRIISSTEEQATGAFVDMINEIRYKELLRKYEAAAARKNGANQELLKLKEDIERLIMSTVVGRQEYTDSLVSVYRSVFRMNVLLCKECHHNIS